MEHDEERRKTALEIALRRQGSSSAITSIEELISDAAKIDKFIASGTDEQEGK